MLAATAAAAANKQNVSVVDDDDDIVASDFQLFFIFLQQQKQLRGGVGRQLGWCTERGFVAKVDFVAASSVFFLCSVKRRA